MSKKNVAVADAAAAAHTSGALRRTAQGAGSEIKGASGALLGARLCRRALLVPDVLPLHGEVRRRR